MNPEETKVEETGTESTPVEETVAPVTEQTAVEGEAA